MTIKCPFCAEEIQDGAIKCKHCGSDLTKVAVSAPTKPAPMVNWKRVGIVALVALVAVITIVAMTNNIDLQNQSSSPAPAVSDADIVKPTTTPVQASATVAPVATPTPTPAPKPKPKPVVQAPKPQPIIGTIYSTKGSGPDTTDSLEFNINHPISPSTDFSMVWSYDCQSYNTDTDEEEGTGNFIATIYTADGREVGMVNKLGGNDAGSVDFPNSIGTGQFYVEVISECSWNFDIIGQTN